MPARPQINRTVRRPDRGLVDRLAKLGVATVHEANYRTGFMSGLSAVTGGVTVAGTALTCLNFAGDNLMLHAALDVAQSGDLLIVAVTAPSTHGMFGELLATACAARGVVGVVLDAGIRDVAELRAMRFPAWSRAVSAVGTAKAIPGWVNIPVSCGGVVVCPGDVVVADDDGVVVVSHDDVEEVFVAAEARECHEAELRQQFAAGGSSLDATGRRELVSPYVVES